LTQAKSAFLQHISHTFTPRIFALLWFATQHKAEYGGKRAQ
jgi:hypothetical protein